MHCLLAGRVSIVVACVCMCMRMHIEVVTASETASSDGLMNVLHPLVSLEAARLLPDSVAYHQILPLPNNPYQAMVYASWTGFSLRLVCLIAFASVSTVCLLLFPDADLAHFVYRGVLTDR